MRQSLLNHEIVIHQNKIKVEKFYPLICLRSDDRSLRE
jgi:hypothetical protein